MKYEAGHFHKLLRDHSLDQARRGDSIIRTLYVKWARKDHHIYLRAKRALKERS